MENNQSIIHIYLIFFYIKKKLYYDCYNLYKDCISFPVEYFKIFQ